MNAFLTTKTKTIRTYGKRSHRVVNRSTWVSDGEEDGEFKIKPGGTCHARRTEYSRRDPKTSAVDEDQENRIVYDMKFKSPTSEQNRTRSCENGGFARDKNTEPSTVDKANTHTAEEKELNPKAEPSLKSQLYPSPSSPANLTLLIPSTPEWLPPSEICVSPIQSSDETHRLAGEGVEIDFLEGVSRSFEKSLHGRLDRMPEGVGGSLITNQELSGADNRGDDEEADRNPFIRESTVLPSVDIGQCTPISSVKQSRGQITVGRRRRRRHRGFISRNESEYADTRSQQWESSQSHSPDLRSGDVHLSGSSQNDTFASSENRPSIATDVSSRHNSVGRKQSHVESKEVSDGGQNVVEDHANQEGSIEGFPKGLSLCEVDCNKVDFEADHTLTVPDRYGLDSRDVNDRDPNKPNTPLPRPQRRAWAVIDDSDENDGVTETLPATDSIYEKAQAGSEHERIVQDDAETDGNVGTRTQRDANMLEGTCDLEGLTNGITHLRIDEANIQNNLKMGIDIEEALHVDEEVEVLGQSIERVTLNEVEVNRTTTLRTADLGLEKSLKDLLELAQQPCPFAFDEFFAGSSITGKLGEASYSEVFAVEYSRCPGIPAAVKIIPFGGEGDQMGVDEVVKEVMIMNKVARVGKSFVQCLGVGVCVGPWPEWLLRIRDEWDGEMENDRPDYYPATQLHALLILQNGGTDLEHHPPLTAPQCQSLLLQLCLSVANAEIQEMFEHRDLHWGNVLLTTAPPEKYLVDLDGDRIQFSNEGVRICIIDYTWGRIGAYPELVYLPLDDPELFDGKGKGQRGGDLQFDIYRWMRDEVQGEWQKFCPKTNVFWVHYLIDKVLTRKFPRSRKTKDVRIRKELEMAREVVLQYGSVADFAKWWIQRLEL
ncbi:haspin protein kinase [Spizellomyces punctatus DAOM BR117]|uniref:non-specific serine/threonine protein kinase n=1 Tax=Spizellomyces punctatus (strain DAOM BR117) TaxID=645134 RepID=A0A0L0H5J7_SPIPD|nr:haspin protein kinase [Spizellomyces punctatus DAOM BR117]KNC96492.1 haspin protein kinase [Spizellomyces punctatus DAOM BR117]|eukprot:XP_016604532.1 haspin protein kinase [Spizellomyces punctatus DAOM BR117]